MPEESAAPASENDSRENTIGLALSGGGFRAALFGLGALWRLNDAGWLPKITHITSVSGGSITAAYLGMRWTSLVFDANGVAQNFDDLITKPLERFCRLRIDIPSVVKGLLTPGMSIGDFVARAYQRELYQLDGRAATLQDLPGGTQGPTFIIYATNLQTGVSVRLTRESLTDYHLGRLPAPAISLAVAVGASSGFPPFLSPVKLKTDPTRWREPPSPPPANLEKLRAKMILSDGGVYDNMGLEAIFGHCGTVLVSDAGAPVGIVRSPWTNWLGQLARVRGIMMEQTRALRRRMVLASLTRGECRGTLWRIGTQIDDYKLSDAMVRDNAVTEALPYIRTRLNPFSPQEQGQLINWGYALCDAGMRKHVDATIPRGHWPRPAFPL